MSARGHAGTQAFCACVQRHQRAAALSCGRWGWGASAVKNVGPREKVKNAVTASVLLLLAAGVAPMAFAGDQYAIVITGAAGGEAYAQKYDRWRLSFVTTLREKFHYPDDHIVVLADADSAGVLKATRENVRRVLGD